MASHLGVTCRHGATTLLTHHSVNFPWIGVQSCGHSYSSACAHHLVPQMPPDAHEEATKIITTDVLNRCGTRSEGLLLQTITGDATSIHHFAHESKQPSMQWHLTTPPWKTFKRVPVPGLIIPSVRCDETGALVHRLPKGITVEL